MAVDFNDFSQKTTAVSTDYLVGYDLNASGGEKKFTISTIANAVSAIMTPELQSLIVQETLKLATPTGLVAYYSLSAAPTGWIECNGAVITTSIPSYTNLRNFLINGGYKFGAVGSDPKVPDLRGQFIRSFDGGSGIKESFNVLGAITLGSNIITGLSTDELANLSVGSKILTCDRSELVGAVITAVGSSNVTINKTATAADSTLNVKFGRAFGSNQADSFKAHTHTYSAPSVNQKHNFGSDQSTVGGGTTAETTNVTPAGGTETRPVNVALLACIKL